VFARALEKPDPKAVHNDYRLRAAYRHELIVSVAVAARVVAIGVGLAALVTSLLVPRLSLAYAALAAPLLALCAVVLVLLRHRGRHHVMALGMLVGILPMVAAGASLVLLPQSEPIAHGSVGLIPLAFAIFVPLPRRYHGLWLVAANAAFYACLFSDGHQADWLPALPSLVFTTALAAGISLVANEVQVRRRYDRDRQLLTMRSLYGRMKEREQDLHRQDEFLFMQQETLVAQQSELLRLNEELAATARLDPLTGVGNRLRLNEDLVQIAARIERGGGTAGLLLLDLDRFKRLNDSLGHLAGDAALKAVADVLKKTSRAGDGVYRYGGEEFLIILHDCDEKSLRLAGQRYVTAIEAIGLRHKENQPWGVVTASAGATSLSERNCLDVDAALHDADEALYRAKEHGRNWLDVNIPSSPAVVPIERRRAAS
jgi:diguanylate cyclase (GGDEF)-like protein